MDTEIQDNILMQTFQKNGSRAAFNRLVERYIYPARAFASRTLGNAALADDAVQETFLRILRKKNKYTPSKPFAPWFYTILRNICTDMMRKKQTDSSARQSIAADLRKTAPHHEEKEPGPDPAELLRHLSDDEARALVLKFFHNMTFSEIGQAVGCSEEAAKKRSQRGLRRLREKYNKF